MAEQLNFFKEQNKKEGAELNSEERPEEDITPKPTIENEEWLLQQKEGAGSHLITEEERKKYIERAKRELKLLKEKLDSKQKKLKFE